MVNLFELTNNSWLVKINDISTGILVNYNTYYLYITTNDIKEFSSIDKIEKYIGKIKFNKSKKKDKLIDTINGYPLKHTDITVISDDPPYYVKNGGKVQFSSGYWGIKFSNIWVPTFCPKVSTTLTNESIGPFKNRLEMLNKINSYNNSIGNN